MNDTGIRPEVIEEIRNLAQKYDIEKVILFGSRARGDFRRTSDIDIAVTTYNSQINITGTSVVTSGS